MGGIKGRRQGRGGGGQKRMGCLALALTRFRRCIESGGNYGKGRVRCGCFELVCCYCFRFSMSFERLDNEKTVLTGFVGGGC